MMKEENKVYITGLNVRDVPWHRLTTAYGRGTNFPVYFEVLTNMNDLKEVTNAIYELTTNMEHQSTLWHATPFGMIFMNRILIKALEKRKNNDIADYVVNNISEFLNSIIQCFIDGNKMEHADQLPLFSDMLQEKYLWSEEYDEEDDELRYEEEEVFPDDLFYSFYYYSLQSILAYKENLEKYIEISSISKTIKILNQL